MLCRWIRPHHYIVLLGSLSMIAFFTAYGIAVSANHVNALFPYISETGTKAPESCVFGFLLNLSSLLAFICMFIRHENYSDQNFIQSSRVTLLNDVGMIIGFLSALGMCVVANFQETNVLSVHLVGACMVFGFGVMYCWIHSYLSYKSLAYGMNRICTVWLRFIMSFFVTCFMILTFVGASIASLKWKNGNHRNDTMLEWKKSDPGYDWHLTSTFSEWLMAIFFICYFFTFYQEFRKIRLITKVHQSYHPDSSSDPAVNFGQPVMG